MERMLSDKEIRALEDNDQKTIRHFRSCIRRSSMHVHTKRGSDRRTAMSSFVDPSMERRSGLDRRNN